MVEFGSLSAAARQLNLSQPTLGRHIGALEEALEVPLFERTLQGFKPTEIALRLYEPVMGARTALAKATLVAEGASPALNGTVRLTSSTVMCHYILPPLLGDIRAEFPGIALDIVPSDTTENLLLREADIAVRMFRPTQLELIARKLGALPIVCCAHADYLARRGVPRALSDLTAHDLIGADRSDLLITTARALGLSLTRASFTIRTDSQTAAWELTKAGLGIGFAQRGLVEQTPGMTTIFADIGVPPLEVWLTTHRELFTNQRIRVIYDRLADALRTYINGATESGSLFDPSPSQPSNEQI